MTFTKPELAYLIDQPLGRVATIGPGGEPHVNPVAYWVDTEAHTIEFSGPFLARSQKFRNLAADPRISFVVDDMADHPVGPGGQTGRGIEIRGRAELLSLDQPPRDGFSSELVRIHPARVIAWNIDGPGPNRRDVGRGQPPPQS
jgi:pyridoxamine 5'-phosphate oxidase family protein